MTNSSQRRLPARSASGGRAPTGGAAMGVEVAALVAQTVAAVVQERTEQARIAAHHAQQMQRIAAKERLVTRVVDTRLAERREVLDTLAGLAAEPAVLADTDSLARVVNAMVEVVATSPFDGLADLAGKVDDERPGPVIEGELA